MGLRCKSGQMVILTLRDKVVPQVAHFAGHIYKTREVCYGPVTGEAYWKFDPPVYVPKNGLELTWTDAACDPIEDQDGEDETFKWAGKPIEAVRKLSEREFEKWEKKIKESV